MNLDYDSLEFCLNDVGMPEKEVEEMAKVPRCSSTLQERQFI